ncbi:MAG: TonB-dependent receptor [Hyphomonadaceae bacterium]|nr:TonB-dependent receptor [Hyphomonadaceae bacterium]
MENNHRGLRLALFAGLASSALAAPLPALAQNASPEATADNSEEIVVTARRREEREIDVPIAMTVNTGEQLEERGAADITALQRTTPNLTMQVSRGTNSTLTAFIRGIGQQDPLWGFEPGVGLYVDDVYIARPQGAVLDIYDVDRIEVLRGPQGTLYGRNTIGGAVKYVTRRLDPDEPMLHVRGEAGSYNELNTIITGSVPLTEELRVGGALARYTRDGYGDNVNLNQEQGNRDALAGRLSIEFEPTSRLFFRLAGDVLWDDSNINNGHRETPGIGAGGTPPVLDSPYDTRAGIGYRGQVETRGLSLLSEWEVNDHLTFKSITAYRDGSTHGDGIDFDGLPEPYFDIPGFYEDHQLTQEFQAQFDYGRLQGVAGVYYLDGMARGEFDAILGLFGITQVTSGQVDTTSLAAFADVSYDFTDRFSVSVGGRWTRDDKEAEVFKANYFGLGIPSPSAVPFGILTNYTNERTFEEFTPRFSASYSLTPDFNLYASYGRGFKSGGFDMRGDATATPDTMRGYDPEIVDSYEIGFKSFLFDHRLRLNGAVFDAAYEGQQVPAAIPVGATVVSRIDNVGSSTIRGAELEGSATMTDWLTANFSVGYVDASFDEYVSFTAGAPGNGIPCIANPPSPPTAVGCYADVANLRTFQNTPEWNGFLGVTVHGPLWGGQIAVTPSLSFRSDTSLFETPNPQLDQPAYQLVDLSVVWTSENDHWRIGLHGRNLTDEHYKTGGYYFPTAAFANSVISFYGPPRTARLAVEYRF